MAKKKVVDEGETELDTAVREAVEADAAAAEKRAVANALLEQQRAEDHAAQFEPGRVYIGLDQHGGVTYVEVAEGTERDRTHLINGANFEHVAEDADGRWLYRRM